MADELDNLLNARGNAQTFAAPVTAAAFSSGSGIAGFAMGDGTLRLTGGGGTKNWSSVPAHDGAILALSPHPDGRNFLTGGDDGRLLAAGAAGVTEIASFGMMKWVEHVAAFAGKAPLIAATVGKVAHLFGGDGSKLREFAHPSSVTGLAFDAKGKRLAASHYNGASLWFTGGSATPKLYEWKGSHTGVALHPGGDAVVTAMQENALHGWTLPEGKHMRMSGYPAKAESFGFTRNGRWLATAGADVIVLWPFVGGGPMGKPPTELGEARGRIVKRVATHPEHEVVAAGFDNGMVIVADIPRSRVLPVCAPGRGGVTALAWNATGSHLALGTEAGFAAVVDFSTPD